MNFLKATAIENFANPKEVLVLLNFESEKNSLINLDFFKFRNDVEKFKKNLEKIQDFLNKELIDYVDNYEELVDYSKNTALVNFLNYNEMEITAVYDWENDVFIKNEICFQIDKENIVLVNVAGINKKLNLLKKLVV